MLKKGNEYHIPVLYNETLEMLVTNLDGAYLDCTLGGGSHSSGILETISDKGVLVSIDQDDQAIEFSKKRLEKYSKNNQIFKNNFENLDIVSYMSNIDKFDGILMDIGVSSTQLDDPTRGFSYRFDNKLDMRMNKDGKLSAYEVINDYPEEKLSKIIYEYGEERNARKIARFICEHRKIKKIETTFELVDIIRKAYPKKTLKHPAKKTFQAIRIEVNRELEVLEIAIRKAAKLLKPKGRLCIITFHSLEDRLVKNLFKELSLSCTCPPDLPFCICNKKQEFNVITKKPIVPSDEELKENNRAHSSKLRVLEKI